MSELLPCPFNHCDGAVELRHAEHQYWVECLSCGAHGGIFTRPEIAIEWWNTVTRAQPIAPAPLLASALAHRACHSAEHDPRNGKLHGYCVVCGVPWPCDAARQFIPAPAPGVGEAGQKEIGSDFYKGMEWFACWLLDNVEGETITEEQLRPWAVKAWQEHLKRMNPESEAKK